MEEIREKTLTEQAMEMLALFDNPKFKEKRRVAMKLEMSIRQVYRAWDRVEKEREKAYQKVSLLAELTSYLTYYKSIIMKLIENHYKITKKDGIKMDKIDIRMLELKEHLYGLNTDERLELEALKRELRYK